jgi:hypothetical protein
MEEGRKMKSMVGRLQLRRLKTEALLSEVGEMNAVARRLEDAEFFIFDMR